jgi:hypothetical protein
MGLAVNYRNSDRKVAYFRYPSLAWMEGWLRVPSAQMSDTYFPYTVFLNVNTLDDSPSMFSRRLVVIVRCGGFAVMNPSP